jgi:hypothetical protein
MGHTASPYLRHGRRSSSRSYLAPDPRRAAGPVHQQPPPGHRPLRIRCPTVVASSRAPGTRGCCLVRSVTIFRMAGRSRTSAGAWWCAASNARAVYSGAARVDRSGKTVYSTSIERSGSMRRRRRGLLRWRAIPLATGVYDPAGEGIEDASRLLAGVDGRGLVGSQVCEHDVGRSGQGFDQRFGRRMQQHCLASGERGQTEAELQFPGDTEPGLHPEMAGGPRGDRACIKNLAGGGRGEGLVHDVAQEESATGWLRRM